MSTHFGDIEWITYQLSGTTLVDVVAAASSMPEAGHADWQPHYDDQITDGVVTSVAVSVGFQITLPNWDNYYNASQPEQSEWDRFHAALEAHERGHLDIVTPYFSDVEHHMVGQHEADAAAVFQHAIQSAQAASDAYDQSTNHGQSTGTVIDVSVVPAPPSP